MKFNKIPLFGLLIGSTTAQSSSSSISKSLTSPKPTSSKTTTTSTYATIHTTCVTTLIGYPPYSVTCSLKGTLPSPSPIAHAITTNQTACRNSCLDDPLCSSFSYKSAGKACDTFSLTLQEQNFLSTGKGPLFWDRGCYGSLCCGANGTQLCKKQGEGGFYYVCSDPKDDVANCGACGKNCNDQQKCVNGKCKAACPKDRSYCFGECVDTKTNQDSCGACGTTCNFDQTCKNGTCTDICQPGLSYCSSTLACLDTQNDFNNCGDCGNVCANGQTCNSGTCECPPGQEVCNGQCTEVGTTNNCAGCGDACPANFFCNNKKCQCYDPALEQCDNQCVDLKTNHDNCGYCGKKCPGNAYCEDGACVCQNRKQWACIGDGVSKCADIGTDMDHCMKCFNKCDPATEICSAGWMGCICKDGLQRCRKTGKCQVGPCS